jgi:DNA-binding XRE family transcriptional regulator
MYPNLLGQKAYHNMSNDDMAKVINVSRKSYESKVKTGRFTLEEGRAYCKFFGKDFDYLFALNDPTRTA